MILATFVGVLFIPPLFVISEKITEKLSRKARRRDKAKIDAD